MREDARLELLRVSEDRFAHRDEAHQRLLQHVQLGHVLVVGVQLRQRVQLLVLDDALQSLGDELRGEQAHAALEYLVAHLRLHAGLEEVARQQLLLRVSRPPGPHVFHDLADLVQIDGEFGTKEELVGVGAVEGLCTSDTEHRPTHRAEVARLEVLEQVQTVDHVDYIHDLLLARLGKERRASLFLHIRLQLFQERIPILLRLFHDGGKDLRMEQAILHHVLDGRHFIVLLSKSAFHLVRGVIQHGQPSRETAFPNPLLVILAHVHEKRGSGENAPMQVEPKGVHDGDVVSVRLQQLLFEVADMERDVLLDAFLHGIEYSLLLLVHA